MAEAADKYDRQLRLWGAHGQRCLSEAHILLLKAGPTGTETLKNLVLPGIGQFTVVDSGQVRASDVANNFFTPADALGQSRAETACALLQELNPDARGVAVVEDPLAFVRALAAKDEARRFTLVIATELTESDLLLIEDVFYPLHIPIVVARTYGLLGCLRIVTHSHCVVEAKPSPAPVEDLRIADPFPELAAFADRVDLASLDSRDFQHTPYVVLLVKLVQGWRAAHGGGLPQTAAEKAAFRDSVKAQARKPWGEEENLGEALENAFLAYSAKRVPEHVQALLAHPHCRPGAPLDTADAFNARFWALARGLRGFLEAQAKGAAAKLPLSGALPDMTATTGLYVEMQRVFKARAEADAQDVLARARAEAASIPGARALTEEDARVFCRNAAHVQCVRSSRLRDEQDPSRLDAEELESAVMEGVGDATPQCPLLFLMMLRACDRFHAAHGRFPGENGRLEAPGPGEAAAEDAAELLRMAKELAASLPLSAPLELTQAHAQEMVRYAGVELHNVAAVVGGIASQEAVKLLTHQYVLLAGTYVFNGITCTGACYNLAPRPDP